MNRFSTYGNSLDKVSVWATFCGVCRALHGGLARVRQARRYALEAVRTLRLTPVSKSLALAYSMLGQWHMHQNRVKTTIYWSEKAVALAQTLRDVQPRIDALTNIGTGLSKRADFQTGIQQVEMSLPFDAIAEHYYDSTEAYEAAFASPEAQKGVEDAKHFMDFDTMPMMVVKEHPIALNTRAAE
jgi:hypothetical protein